MLDRTAQLAAEIGKLPALKHVELLIEHFFNTCYPLVLFIDKESMVPKLYLLIQDKGDYCIISHSKRKQRVEIAILLIILRFGFISLPSKGRVSNLKISTYYIECASRLLISLVTLKIVTFTTVQGFLLLLVYRMHCPEDDDSLHDVAMLQSMIIQSAREIGLDRNPKSYPSQFLDSKTMYFWRNAWIHICYFNTSRTFEQGQCPSTNISASDTSFILLNNLKFQQSPGVFRNLEYMESVSQSVGDVMLNLVDKRIVDERSICQLLKYLNSILENDTRTFRQLRTQDKYILVEGGLSERVREFILRLDLSFKSYSLYYFLYLNLSDDNEFQTKEKNQYLALAIEKALILLKVNHEFSKDPSAMFGTEYENIIASRIWRNLKMVLSCVISLIVRIHEGKCSLSDAFGYFDSPDSSGLIRWAGIRYDDEKQTMLNIAHVLEELYTNGMSSCTKFYSCFKSCLFIWYGVHYLQVKFPEIFAPVAAHNWSLENYFADLCPLDEVGEFWDDQHGLNSAPDVDLFFSKLGIDFDDLSKNMDNG